MKAQYIVTILMLVGLACGLYLRKGTPEAPRYRAAGFGITR